MVTMSTPEQRMRMAKRIVDFEARRDKKGHLQVYKLPAWDGGGRYELSRTALSEPALVQCLPLPSKILQSFSMTFAPHASATRVVGRDERSKPWKGLVNRWYNALKFARTLLPAVPTPAPKGAFEAMAAHAAIPAPSFGELFFLLVAASSRASCAAARPRCRTTPSARHSISTWRRTKETIARR